MSSKDYLGTHKPEAGDRLDHGIMGMRWGRRRTDTQIAKDHLARKASGEQVTKTAKAAAAESKPADHKSNIQDHVESSSARYSRLAQQAKAGKASDMTEQDLKFFNARTEALAKINKMNQKDEGWLKKTTTTVLQNAAQRQMQTIANGIADKYIASPLLKNLEKSDS